MIQCRKDARQMVISSGALCTLCTIRCRTGSALVLLSGAFHPIDNPESFQISSSSFEDIRSPVLTFCPIRCWPSQMQLDPYFQSWKPRKSGVESDQKKAKTCGASPFVAPQRLSTGSRGPDPHI